MGYVYPARSMHLLTLNNYVMRSFKFKRLLLWKGVLMYIIFVMTSCSTNEKQDIPLSMNTIKEANSAVSYQRTYTIIADVYNQCDILDYYNSDAVIELQSHFPYTYIMQKYMDIFIDFLVDIDAIMADTFCPRCFPYNLNVESKKEYILSIISDLNVDTNPEEEDLCASELDEFCYVLDCMLYAEVNMMDEVQNFINEAVAIADFNGEYIDEENLLQSSHIEIGNMPYHKIDILLHIEDSISYLHQHEEEMENMDCSCGIIPRMPSAQRVVKFNLFSLWPNGVVKYRNRQCPDMGLMDMAMSEWSTAANGDIQFVEIKDNGWNRFLWTIGCSYHVCLKETTNSDIAGSSTIGYVPWASISMNANATEYERYFGSYLHELGHTLGLLHEIQRCDRGNYVYIDWSSIKLAYYFNFVMLPSVIASPYGPFDFNSIMMYNQTAFSRTGDNTIIPIDGSSYNRSCSLSQGDCININMLY